MAVSFAFLSMLLASLVVALLAALQLADFFGAGAEFVLVLAAIAVFAAGSMSLFAAVYAAASRVREIHLAAWLLLLIALVLTSMPSLREWIAEGTSDPFKAAREQELQITLEILIPAALMVLVQWGLVRRRWLRAVGEEELSLWPWFATAVAALAVLNPFGLAAAASTLAQSSTDWVSGVRAAAAGAAIVVLVVMTAIECYIRARMRRRRMPPASPLVGGGAQTPA